MSDIQIVGLESILKSQFDALGATIQQQKERIKTLETQLLYERDLRKKAEAELAFIKTQPKKTRKRREVTLENNSYSDFKSDGKRKAHAADAIRSYDDFFAIQKYYLDAGRVRDWMMWTVGVSLGLRVSDLLSLRFGNVIDRDKKSFLPRIQVYEKKTGKLNECLITESVKHALSRYLDTIKWQFDLDDFIFTSRKTGQKLDERSGWRILSSAGRALNLPLNVGSHTMRKSFANIAACVDKSCIDMNAITKIQGLLNHGDQRVTMRYLGSYQAMFDRARQAVSDFVLGNTGVNEIIAGNQYTIDDIFERLDAFEQTILKTKENPKNEDI